MLMFFGGVLVVLWPSPHNYGDPIKPRGSGRTTDKESKSFENFGDALVADEQDHIDVVLLSWYPFSDAGGTAYVELYAAAPSGVRSNSFALWDSCLLVSHGNSSCVYVLSMRRHRIRADIHPYCGGDLRHGNE